MASDPSDLPPCLVAVDWGTSRFRAFLLGTGGAVLAETEGAEGIAALAGKGHGEAFGRHCGAWRAAHPDTPVLLAGMVGSRNGWIEADYAGLPAGLDDLARALTPVELPAGGTGWIVPGLIRRGARPDVLRGEEVLALGAAPAAGRAVLCLPGTHSKWLTVVDGRIVDFTSFVTGELYGLLAEASFIGALAAPGTSPAAFAAGLEAAEASDGLLARLFTARAGVLAGSLPPEGVRDYLSGLVIGSELSGARAALRPDRVILVAGGDLAERYAKAAAAVALPCEVLDTRTAFIAGSLRVAEAAAISSQRHRR